VRRFLHSESGSNVLINLKIGNETKSTILKELQRDVLTQAPMHIDFLAVSLKEKIEVVVHIKITGEAPGVKLSGGILEHVIRDIRVSCLPTDIPSVIEVSVATLNINQALMVKDLPKLSGVEYVADPDAIIVHIVAPSILEETTPAVAAAAAATPGAAAAAEPEVISKGKKEKEEGAAEEKKGAK
jgi:large subunit ribosomal protein L25